MPTQRTKTRRVMAAVTVARAPDEAYRFWRDLDNLPRFVARLGAAQGADERRSRWSAKAKGGVVNVELTEDRPEELLAFRLVDGTRTADSVRVRFTSAPGGRGTEVHAEAEYEPPGGLIAAVMGGVVDEVARGRLASDLRRFKQLVETGEVV